MTESVLLNGLAGGVAASLVVGCVLALGYFGALWLTVSRLPRARHPVLLALASLGLRLSWAGFGFYVVLGWGPLHLVAALLAFLAVRAALVRLAGGGRLRAAAASSEVEPWT